MDVNQVELLDWIHLAIREAIDGNPGELEKALELVEYLRDS
jgi:hypothetical protein